MHKRLNWNSLFCLNIKHILYNNIIIQDHEKNHMNKYEKQTTSNQYVQKSTYLDTGTGPVFTNILILRIVLFLEFFLEFFSFLRIILRIRISKFEMFWNIPKFVLFKENFIATL